MRLAPFAFLTGVLLISHATFASDIPEQWLDCKTSADCSVVSSSCGPSMGINFHHKAEAQAEICKTEDCSGACDASAIQAYAGMCKNEKCVPDYNAKPPPAPTVNYQLKGLSLSEPTCDGKPCNGKAWVTH